MLQKEINTLNHQNEKLIKKYDRLKDHVEYLHWYYSE
jgi:chaperonin cofactor prefoldin